MPLSGFQKNDSKKGKEISEKEKLIEEIAKIGNDQESTGITIEANIQTKTENEMPKKEKKNKEKVEDPEGLDAVFLEGSKLLYKI